jgi:hypothetical protein
LELSRQTQEDENDLDEWIEDSIRIDNQYYEYRRDKQFFGANNRNRVKPNTGRPRYSKQRYTREETYGNLMELDMISSRNNLSQEEKNRRREQKLCFEYGFPGHQARDCRKKSQKGKPRKKGNWKGKKQLKTIVGQGGYQGTPGYQISMMSSRPVPQGNDHVTLSWTACYNNQCLVHQQDKDGVGWYLRKPKKEPARQDSPPGEDEVWLLEKINE